MDKYYQTNYIKIVGSDGHEFYLDEVIAELCYNFRMLIK